MGWSSRIIAGWQGSDSHHPEGTTGWEQRDPQSERPTNQDQVGYQRSQRRLLQTGDIDHQIWGGRGRAWGVVLKDSTSPTK